ncbi:MAG TPA: methyl-accepting chemotaxis protein [Candidatus Acidoferrum sp.]|nr:methyl-accepting chemotaxis protein [Candidatus Acidoferrum sp.]
MKKIRLFKRIGTKLSLFTACAIIAVGTVSVYYVSGSYQDVIGEINTERSEKALVTLDSVVEDFRVDSKKAAESLAGYDLLVGAVEGGNAAAVRAAAGQAVGDMGFDVDFVTVTDALGNVIARTHSDKAGDSVAGQKNVSQALAGEATTHTDLGTEIPLSIRTGAPIKNAAGQIIGAVSTGYSLVNPDFADKLKSMTGNEFTIFIGDVRANTTIMQNGERVVGTQLDPAIAKIVLEERTLYMGQADILGAPYATAYAPILDTAGAAIGVYFAGIPLSAIEAMSKRTILSSAAIEVVMVVLVNLVLVFYMRKKISRPLAGISQAAGEMSRGNLGLQIAHRSKDEFGELADAFRATVAALQSYINDISEKLEQMSKGDMQVQVDLDYLGDFLPIKHSIENIAASLNATLSTINAAAGQVSTGSEQVAAGAQELATGSTEQAASIEQLSASIEKVAGQAGENSATVVGAAEIARQSSEAVAAGNEQMRQLTAAMSRVESSSGQIANITKVIEDIAFQTNILALNAAIEAARAGSAGKGFAVVAEEVRSLAAKSGEAAKETANLILRSVEDVKSGTGLTARTAGILKDIGDSAKEMVASFEKIEQASAAQAGAIEQIRDGLTMISSVVQTNAATAEENSATSEEMSAQAAMLSREVGKFKLAVNTAHHAPMPQPLPSGPPAKPKSEVSILLGKY